MQRFSPFILTLLFFVAPLFATPPSNFKSGVDIRSNLLTGTATATLYINSNTASYSRIIQGLSSGTAVFEVQRGGVLKINKITAMTGNHLKIGSDTSIAVKLPSFTTTERGNIIPPANGMMVYNSTVGRPQVYTAGVWQNIVPASGTTVPHLVDFSTISPSTETGKAGGYDEARGTITLSPTTEQGARFGMQIVPPFWDSTSSMSLKLYLGTPTGAALASMVLQLKIQSLGAGNGFFSDSAWVTIGTFTATLASTTAIQTISGTSFRIPISQLGADKPIAISINRIGGHANDTHPAQIHIMKIRGIINE